MPDSTSPTTISALVAELAVTGEWLRARWRHELGLSSYEMLALTHLVEQPLTVGELGTRLALTSGAMTGLVNRLVDAGHLERRPDPRDRRKVLVALTLEAREKMQAVEAPLRRRLETIDANMPTEVMPAVRGALGAVVRAHRQALEERS